MKIHWCEGTPDQVKRVLVGAMNNRQRVRLFLGDPDTGRDWCEEMETMGYIGVSSGRLKVPILLPTKRSRFGPQISTDRVLKIKIEGRIVYQSPRYQVPELEVRGREVLRDGQVIARHKSESKAQSWVRFMRGDIDRWG